MTTEPTPDELLEDEARLIADEEPDRIPDANDLPSAVEDGRVPEHDEHDEDDPAVQDEPVIEPKEI